MNTAAATILLSLPSVGSSPREDQTVAAEPAALVARIAAREEAALGHLYDSTSRLIYGLVLRLVQEPATAEDITMEVYLQVWRTAHTFSASRGSVNSWLLIMARSRAIDWLRSGQARFNQHRQSLEVVEELRDATADPQAACEDRDRSEVVRRAVNTLPEEQRRLIEMGYFSGLSHSEIAEELGLPLGTVKSRIRTGMLRLRGVLRPYAESAR